MPLSSPVTDVTVFSGTQKPNTKHLYKGAQGSSLTSCFKVCQEASDSPLVSARRNSSFQLESGKSPQAVGFLLKTQVQVKIWRCLNVCKQSFVWGIC